LSLCLTNYVLRHEGVWGSEGIPPPILTSTLVRGEWSASRPGRFTPGKEPRYPLNKRMGGPQSWFERRREERILDSIGTRTPTPQSSSL
jgi:hypothetical protein